MVYNPDRIRLRLKDGSRAGVPGIVSGVSVVCRFHRKNYRLQAFGRSRGRFLLVFLSVLGVKCSPNIYLTNSL